MAEDRAGLEALDLGQRVFGEKDSNGESEKKCCEQRREEDATRTGVHFFWDYADDNKRSKGKSQVRLGLSAGRFGR